MRPSLVHKLYLLSMLMSLQLITANCSPTQIPGLQSLASILKEDSNSSSRSEMNSKLSGNKSKVLKIKDITEIPLKYPSSEVPNEFKRIKRAAKKTTQKLKLTKNTQKRKTPPQKAKKTMQKPPQKTKKSPKATDAQQKPKKSPQKTKNLPQKGNNLPKKPEKSPQKTKNLPQKAKNLPKKPKKSPQKTKNLPQKAKNLPKKLKKSPQKTNVKTISKNLIKYKKPSNVSVKKSISKSTPSTTVTSVTSTTTLKTSLTQTMADNPENPFFLNAFPPNITTINDDIDCHFHIFHGAFKLITDVNPLDLSDDHYWTMSNKEGCIFKSWEAENINIVLIDILTNQNINTEALLGRIIKKNVELKRKNYEEPISGQGARLKRSPDDEVQYVEKIIGNVKRKITQIVGLNQTFSAPKHPESYLNFSKIENSGAYTGFWGRNFTTVEPKNNSFYRMALEKYARLKPPKRIEHDGKWVARKTADSIDYDSSIPFHNFTDLINVVNKVLLKTEGSHMLLWSDKFDPVISEKMNPHELLSRLAEKSLKTEKLMHNNLNPNIRNELGSQKIVLSHFVTDFGNVRKKRPLDILQVKFKNSPKLQSLASEIDSKSFLTKQVAEKCLFVPVLRKSVFEIRYPDNKQSDFTSLQGPMQLKQLKSDLFSTIHFSNLPGKFVLQMNKTCAQPFSVLEKNRTKISGTDHLNFSFKTDREKPFDDSLSDLRLARSHPGDYVKKNSSEKYEISNTGTLKQQSIGIDYWIPDQVFGFLFSKIFTNNATPQETFWTTPTSTASPSNIEEMSVSKKLVLDGGNDPSVMKNLESIENVTYSLKQDSSTEQLPDKDNSMFWRRSEFKLQNPAVESDDFENFHGLFRLKTKEGTSDDGNQDSRETTLEPKNFEGMWRLKPRLISNTEESLDDLHEMFKQIRKQKAYGNQGLPSNVENDLNDDYTDEDSLVSGKNAKSVEVKDSAKWIDLLGLFQLKPQLTSPNPVQLSTNDFFIEESEKGMSIKERGEVENSHRAFRLKSKDETSYDGVNLRNPEDIQNDEYKIEDENGNNLTFKEVCELLHKSSGNILHPQNFHRVFRLKNTSPHESSLKTNETEIFDNENFHGLFRLKSITDAVEATESSTVLDQFHGVFRLKTKTKGETNLSNRPVDSDKLSSWCRIYFALKKRN